MIEYVTTNIRLPRELHRELKRRALDEDKSMSQVIRESVAQYLVTTTMDAEVESNQKMLEVWQNDSVWSIGTEPVIADVTDGSVNHDDCLYGALSHLARAELGDE